MEGRHLNLTFPCLASDQAEGQGPWVNGELWNVQYLGNRSLSREIDMGLWDKYLVYTMYTG